ncbi:MAG: phage holin [Firmicutes bacterium]|nr:phage holin [Bacillota bacterium]MBQ6686382.1 phage holin [Bacillota bacterium]
MKINWKVRFKNKTWLLTFLAAIIGFAYQILNMFGVMLPIEEGSVIQVVTIIVEALVVMGVLIDPTTAGTSDSQLAMTYQEPKQDI